MKSDRHRAREFALQGLYQWQLTQTDPATIARELGEARGFEKIDAAYFRDLLQGALAARVELEGEIACHLDRALERLSPVERSILLLAGYELAHRREIPFRVIVNEAVELAKAYGGTDGYRFVNGVLDKLAARLREGEVKALS